jgi:DNA-binding response OmpR family regulator
MPKILVVEDDEKLSFAVQCFLKSEHHVVDVVATGEEAIERLSFYTYDMAIIYWILPGLSGVEVCRQYRAKGGHIPILILTAKGQIKDKLTGLDSGSDDYLTKPFDLDELSARVRALLRRPGNIKPAILTVGDLSLDPSSLEVVKNGLPVHLPPKEFALLEFFMRHPNEVFTAEALIERIWSSESDASPESIRPYVYRLRSKVETGKQPPYIKTMRGKGYMLVTK